MVVPAYGYGANESHERSMGELSQPRCPMQLRSFVKPDLRGSVFSHPAFNIETKSLG